MTLADYERRKFELSEVLHGLAALRPRPAPAGDPVQALMARLAEDRFNLVVVGRFSRGKSTLMNAILGADRLPTGIVPLTSVVTSVGYGSDELVRLTYEDRILQSDVPLSELRDYVTEEGNPGNRRRVKLAEIQLPAEILRRGFYFIDTPGLGSAIIENSQTTRAFLPSADALILVTGFESPVTAEEESVLQVVASLQRPVFVVVNKQDTVSPGDREAALAFVRERLQSLFGDPAPPVFATSATQALRAKQTGDADELRFSGLADLEAALIRFLVEDKSRTVLLNMCERIEAVMAATPGAAPALQLELHAIRSRLMANEGDAGPTVGGLAPVSPEAARTCAVCTAIDGACFDFLAQYQYALTVDGEVRRAFADAGGFCRLHTWRYNTIASPQGTCLGFPSLTERWSARLLDLAEGSDPPAGAAEVIRRLAGQPDRCPVCQACDQAEEEALEAARLRLASIEAVDRESAFCLDHLAKVIERLRDEAVTRALLRRQAGLFERIGDDMRRYALKFEAIRRPLASRAETASPGRALRLLAGIPNLSINKRPD